MIELQNIKKTLVRIKTIPMKSKAFLILAIISSVIYSFKSENEEYFNGYSNLIDCKEDIPVEYSTKKKGPFLEAAERLKDVKIVLITINKKEKPSYEYYYLVTSEGTYGSNAYLTTPEDYNNESAYKSALFLKYKEKKHFFYKAECFDQKLIENPELNELLIKM
jgi:hypothetical protein